jgi:acetamidase/formamidase
MAALVSCAAAQPAPAKPDVTLGSRPETVIWGYFSARVAPALRIKSGQTVRIDTVSHQGLINNMDPVKFFGEAGIPAKEVLPDAIAIYEKVQRPKDASVHVLTGPIYIEGAEPGDMLEVRMLDFEFRVPYGVNNSGKGSGVLPDVHAKPYPKVIRLDLSRRVALFAPGIEVPLAPFMGIMAVMPPDTLQSTRPPGNYTGDSHAVQADGEVNGTAIEASLTGTFQFIVHKGAGRAMKWPAAEDAANYYVMGMDVDLDTALKEAAQETIAFLQREKGLSPADAYSLASIGVNYTVAEAVDHVQMVYGAIPKRLFATNRPFWKK